MLAVKAEFTRSLSCRRVDSSNRYSDKIYLPQSYLSALLDRNGSSSGSSSSRSNDSDFRPEHSSQLPSPLVFRLSQRGGRSDSATAFCGVREFSFEEGCVGIPGWLMEEAQLAEDAAVMVEFVRLEKGSFAKLQALDQEARSVADLRSLLESFMRTTLTVLFKGETIRVPVHGIPDPISFVVTELEPADAVDVVDTDLTVDIIHAETDGDDAIGLGSSSSSKGRRTGASTPDVVDTLQPGVSVDVTVEKGQSRLFQLHIPAGTSLATVVATCVDGDASLFGSLLVRQPGPLDSTWHDYSPPSHREKSLRIYGSELPSGANSVHVSLIGYSPVCHATISAVFGSAGASTELPTTPSKPSTDMGTDGSSSAVTRCTNCNSLVPKARFEMHTIVCQRNNVKCSKCDRVFKRGSDEAAQHWHCDKCNEAGAVGDQDKHDHFYHSPQACSCEPAPEYESVVELAGHRRSDCPDRLIECRYCHNIERQGLKSLEAEDVMLGLHAHESYCGNRTISCAKCQANVRIRQVQVHMRLHDMRDRAAKASMVPCANRECSRERAPSNPLGLCSVCFGPFYSGEYDPSHVKLLKRLARTLHTQLTHGCGHDYCRNAFCATGMRNAGSSGEALSQTAAAAKMVPILKAYAPLSSGQRSAIDYKGIDLHLCI